MTRRHELLFALLLQAFPRRFRHRLGESMRDSFAAACIEHRAAGRLRRHRFLWRTTVDMLRAGARERLRPTTADPARSRGPVSRWPPIGRELRTAARLLRRSPGFTATAVAALGLSIGAATTVFSVADGVLFRPLPYQDPDRLVSVSATIRARGMLNWNIPGADLETWQAAGAESLTMGGFTSPQSLTLVLPDAPHEIIATPVTTNFLRVLGVAPASGRDFTRSDADGSAASVMLISNALWRSRFQAAPSIVGESVVTNGTPRVIVGVLPPDFAFPAEPRWDRAPDALVALTDAEMLERRLTGIGRLKPGATAEQAATALDTLAARLRSPSGLRDTPTDGAEVLPLRDILIDNARAIMLLLIGAVASLILIGCANVANLLLARGTDRSGEMALRGALGASRASLVRLQLIESALLGSAGGVVGTAVAWSALQVIAPLVPEEIAFLKSIALDGRALAVSAGLSMATALLFGLGPAWRGSKAGLTSTMAASAARVTPSKLRARQAIVAFEVALATVLVIAGGLMANGMIRLLRLDHGYHTAGVLTMRVDQPRGIKPAAPSIDFVEQVLSTARAVPGAQAVGAINHAPFDKTMYGGTLEVEGLPEGWTWDKSVDNAGVRGTQNHAVSVDYFEAIGATVVRGRGFTSADAGSAVNVAVISDRMARSFPPGLDPVGAWLSADGRVPQRRQIVGVVSDMRDMSLEMGSPHTIYTPLEERGATGLTLMMRTDDVPMSLSGALERAIQTQAGPFVISDVRPLNDILMDSVTARRLKAWLFGSLGTIGLLLASVGIFGVVAYSVSNRTREIGIRMALGSSPAGVRRMVVTEAVAPVLIGLVAGLGVALWLGDLVAAHLYQVGARDLTTYAVAGTTLCAVALLAAWQPARRAARVDPLVALRAE